MTVSLRYVSLVLGLATALTAGSIGVLVATASPEEAEAARSREFVLTATRPINAGQRLAKSDMVWKDVPGGAVPAGAITRDTGTDLAAIGAIATRNILAGEAIAQDSLEKPSAGSTVASTLNPGWRAVTITADAAHATGGAFRPNDRVDLLISVQKDAQASPASARLMASGGQNGPAARTSTTLISNVRVVAINGSIQPPAVAAGETAAAQKDTSITFEVLPGQVQPVIAAASSGQLVVSLRSTFETPPPPPPVSVQSTGAAITAQRRIRVTRQRQEARGTPSRPSMQVDWDVAPPVVVIRGRSDSRAQ